MSEYLNGEGYADVKKSVSEIRRGQYDKSLKGYLENLAEVTGDNELLGAMKEMENVAKFNRSGELVVSGELKTLMSKVGLQRIAADIADLEKTGKPPRSLTGLGKDAVRELKAYAKLSKAVSKAAVEGAGSYADWLERHAEGVKSAVKENLESLRGHKVADGSKLSFEKGVLKFEGDGNPSAEALTLNGKQIETDRSLIEKFNKAEKAADKEKILEDILGKYEKNAEDQLSKWVEAHGELFHDNMRTLEQGLGEGSSFVNAIQNEIKEKTGVEANKAGSATPEVKGNAADAANKAGSEAAEHNHGSVMARAGTMERLASGAAGGLLLADGISRMTSESPDGKPKSTFDTVAGGLEIAVGSVLGYNSLVGKSILNAASKAAQHAV